MLKKIGKCLLNFAGPVAFALAPLAVKAANDVDTGLRQIGGSFRFGGGITSSQDVVQLIVGIIELLLMLAGAIAVLFVIIGGFWYMTSAGNAEQAEKGKTAVINAIIGIVVIILSYVIINVIVRTVERY